MKRCYGCGSFVLKWINQKGKKLNWNSDKEREIKKDIFLCECTKCGNIAYRASDIYELSKMLKEDVDAK